MQKLQRVIEDAPRVAEEIEKRQREELLLRASEGGSRLDVSMALHDERYGGGARPRGSLRKQKREGRILFLVLVIALLIAAVWLINHLHF
jgi:hypothetical protein